MEHNGVSYSERLAYEVSHPPSDTFYTQDDGMYAATGHSIQTVKYKLPASEAVARRIYENLRMLDGLLHPHEQKLLESLRRTVTSHERRE